MRVLRAYATLATVLLTGVAGSISTTAWSQPQIDAKRELWITSVSVVDDPRAQGTGPWSFGGLMTAMAPSPGAAGQFTKDWLRTWDSTAAINTFTLDKRKIDKEVSAKWMKKDGATDFATWTPNFANAPFRLLGIVYRPDLVRFDTAGNVTSAGEARFVYELLNSKGKSQRFTVIFEYGLVGASEADVKAWAERFHALGSVPFGPAYNTALQTVTDRFSGRDSNPAKPNGNGLNQLRTNELEIGSPWQLREFQIATSGGLANTIVRQTPDLRADKTALSNWVNTNAQAVKDQSIPVPPDFQGKPLQTGRADVRGDSPSFFWPKMSITDNDARHAFSLNTCNGCHNGETGNQRNSGSLFRHVSSRKVGKEAKLSGFLTGTTIKDPVSGVTRTFNDLEARKLALQQALAQPGPGPVPESTVVPDLTVAKSRRERTD